MTFAAGAAVVGNSTITGTSPVLADGVATSTVTITLKDAFNNPVSGVSPTFSATGSSNSLRRVLVEQRLGRLDLHAHVDQGRDQDP